MADPRMLTKGGLRVACNRIRRGGSTSRHDEALDLILGYIDALTEQLAIDEDLLWQCLVRLEYDGAMGSVYRAVRARLEGEEDDGEAR